MRSRCSPVKVTIAMLGVLAAGTACAAQVDALLALPGHLAVDSRLHVSAQPSVEALAQLGAAGVRTVINLRPATETPDFDEKAIVEKSGVTYRSLPISGKASLTRENVQAFDRLLNEAQEGKVLMHCASGNRVGALLALRARWLEGKTAEQALVIGKAAGLTGLAADVQVLLEQDVVSTASPPWPPPQ